MAKTIEIKNTMPAGSLFTSAGKLPAGESMALPPDEAKTFIKLGKAARTEDTDDKPAKDAAADDLPQTDSTSLL